MYDHSQQHGKTPFTISDLLKGKDLEIVAAALLLAGKLKVDAVQIFRSQPVVFISLVGSFGKAEETQKDTLADIIERSGDFEVDDMIEQLRQKMNDR